MLDTFSRKSNSFDIYCWLVEITVQKSWNWFSSKHCCQRLPCQDKWWRRWAEVGSVGETCPAFFSVEQITCIVSAAGRFSVRSGWGCEEGNKKSLGLKEQGGVVGIDEAQVGRGRGRHDRIISSSLGFSEICVFFRGRQCCLGEHVWLWVPFNAK